MLALVAVDIIPLLSSCVAPNVIAFDIIVPASSLFIFLLLIVVGAVISDKNASNDSLLFCLFLLLALSLFKISSKSESSGGISDDFDVVGIYVIL